MKFEEIYEKNDSYKTPHKCTFVHDMPKLTILHPNSQNFLREFTPALNLYQL